MLFSVLVLSVGVFGQPVVIDRDEYFTAIGKADLAIAKLERRKIVRVDAITSIGNNEDGTGTKTIDEIHEFALPRSTRQAVTEIHNGSKWFREYIEIDSARYCRDGIQKWRKTIDFCGITALRGYSEGGVHKALKETIGAGTSAETLWTMESSYDFGGETATEIRKIWIDGLGRITKEESRSRSAGAEKDDFVRTAKYEYAPTSPKIRIVAPIK